MVTVIVSQEPSSLCKLYLNYKECVELNRPPGKDESSVAGDLGEQKLGRGNVRAKERPRQMWIEMKR